MDEQQWAKFAKYVPVGARFQYRYKNFTLEGVLLENYPHSERRTDSAPYIDLLQVKFDKEDVPFHSILARYERYWVNGAWHTMRDILMFEGGEQAT